MLYYVTVPYTDVADAMGETVSGFGQVLIRGNDRIEATMTSSLIYEFGFDLACLQVKAGNGFKAHHREMALAGRITSVLGDPYLKAQRDGIRWWTGSAWASAPSPVRH
jgi:hypothetical protein